MDINSITKIDIPQRGKMIQCFTCKGYGLVKKKTEICGHCNGIKCIYCNSSGYKTMPYDTCNVCYGDGEVAEK